MKKEKKVVNPCVCVRFFVILHAVLYTEVKKYDIRR